ncbi:hypothetical protein BCR33DRAFT_710883 [Rhizoclosmatium globosum]|uniref:NADH dehydrogenase [ubiquinone] 1 beta subcomplex subunit 11, mitochondrial n=1 Tax=Rhizoclosmatium globosum TaxID=329046 RepID=A0A1Y2D2N3_9FUNG|nr:hypothetical protein BCR33DRAFT_710883 [Rhizoclosmatium globosum]|eukprot:ORY53457.1 hypothetical protein BCR33DRAFT_710883 [Rhizoclosmatium globosum]
MLGLLRHRLSLRTPTRPLSSSTVVRGGDHHGAHFGGEPAGYFLGDPASASKAKTKYFWEPVFVWGYFGGTAVFLTAYAFSPNKSPSQAAKIEAHRRLEKSGESFGWPLPPDSQAK